MRIIRKIGLNIALMTVALLIGLVLVEVILRVAYPKYADAASPKYERDSVAIWAPRPYRRRQAEHPDTGDPHYVIYNSFAMRQSREFENLDSATNVAFFGDSYTANLSLPVQYSFTEPLDFLLNINGGPVNVLNFGVNGYGTAQSYLRYKGFARKSALDHVFYVLCANDLRNIYESNLYSLGAEGELVRNPVPEPGWWVKIASRLHLTYLVLDARQRLLYARTADVSTYRAAMEQRALHAKHRERFQTQEAQEIQQNFLAERDAEELSEVVDVFVLLLEDWRREVEANGSRFAIVLLPTGREELFKAIIPESFEVISLLDLIRESREGFEWSDIQFKNDGHWAEEGNMLAAMHLYRHLERIEDLPSLSDTALNESLQAYYSAFENWWRPDGSAPVAAALEDEFAGIRKKYLASELDVGLTQDN
jgi:hypothetical protein